MKWFKKEHHQHHIDGCLAAAVELEDGTVVCAMDQPVDEREVV